VRALDGVDFSVRSGEVVALVGDNGAGKSTLIKMIAGIQKGRLGADLVRGRPVAIESATRRRQAGIATVYQDLALCDNLDVVENLFLGREEVAPGSGEVLRSLDEIDMERRSHELLSNLAVTIVDVRAEVGTLSGGPAPAGGDRPLAARRAQVVLLDERPRRSAYGRPRRSST